MEPHQNQKTPLKKREIVEGLANIFQILQGVEWATASILPALGLAVTLQQQPVPQIQVIQIYQSPESQVIIQSNQSQPENLENSLKQLSASEDKETLSKASEAIFELQQVILAKQSELEQTSTQLQAGSYEFTSEQLQARAEIEKLSTQLQAEITKLNELSQRIEASQEAIGWLSLETQQQRETWFEIAREAGKAALISGLIDHPELENLLGSAIYDEDLSGTTSFDKNRRKLYFDIQDFLRLIRTSLLACRPNVLDSAITENQPPLEPIPKYLYASALEFIRDNRVPLAMSEPAAAELRASLNYLINALS